MEKWRAKGARARTRGGARDWKRATGRKGGPYVLALGGGRQALDEEHAGLALDAAQVLLRGDLEPEQQGQFSLQTPPTRIGQKEIEVNIKL